MVTKPERVSSSCKAFLFFFLFCARAVGDNQLIRYKILRSKIKIIIWQKERRITNKTLVVMNGFCSLLIISKARKLSYNNTHYFQTCLGVLTMD